MHRLASRFVLAAWAGFCGVSGLALLADAGWFAPPASVSAMIAPYLPVREALALGAVDSAIFAALLAGVAAVLFAAIVWLGQGADERTKLGEQLAASGLAALFAFFAAANLGGSPIAGLFGTGAGFCFALAATFAALVFDHLVTADESESDEAFRLAMAHIREAEERARADSRMDTERFERRNGEQS